MNFRRYLPSFSCLLALGSLCLASDDQASCSPEHEFQTFDAAFVVKPYLQLGDSPPGAGAEHLALLWHAPDVEAPWTVEYQPRPDGAWRETPRPVGRRIDVPTITPHRLFRAELTGLVPGSEFAYRVRANGNIVFTATARAQKGTAQPFRFVAFGDCGAGTSQQKAIAFQAYLARPDFVLITGDIVYSHGRISEYRDKFWPAYNADEASPLVGAPLMRSTLFVAAPGNHDIAARDLDQYPDGLAYFLYWHQPRNGPVGAAGGPLVPLLTGAAASKAAFIAAAAGAYPRTANFSFDYANAHWTILDSNPYVDWTAPELRAWVERDLLAARQHVWRFVAFHHPGFNSSKAHFNDQQMRLLADLFEAGRVDVVFSGHVHNYQRTFPLRFAPESGHDGKPVRNQNKVPGEWTLDMAFDGVTNTRPQGVIYLVTGAGGNTLYNPEQQDDRGSWQSFTRKFISRVHSITVADVSGDRLTVRQLTADGGEVDRFTVTK